MHFGVGRHELERESEAEAGFALAIENICDGQNLLPLYTLFQVHFAPL
jgi:hypothetical protein